MMVSAMIRRPSNETFRIEVEGMSDACRGLKSKILKC